MAAVPVPADTVPAAAAAAETAAVAATPPRYLPDDGLDLSAVRNDILGLMRDRDHDDGSYAPLFIRFAWHCCGTYDATTNTGGSNGATMRFATEAADRENAGLDVAVALLTPIHAKYSDMLSLADVFVLAGYCAIEATGGPSIRFASGRVDFDLEMAQARNQSESGCPWGDGTFNPSGSRLPAADLGVDPSAPSGCPMHVKEKPTIDAVRGTFERMGFGDKEAVLLIILGHQFGRCHPHLSGYEHPWYAFDPAHWNVYDHGLGYLSLYEFGAGRGQMRERKLSNGKRQYEMSFGGGEPFMMLVSDMALWWDESFRKHVKHYDRNRLEFKRDSCAAWVRLTELGCESLVLESTDLGSREIPAR